MTYRHLLLLGFFYLIFTKNIFAQVTFESAFPNLRFEFPVEIQNPQDDTDRFFVVEQSGRIRVFSNNPTINQSQVETFLDIRNKVAFVPGNDGQEIGLLGLAFHPDYAQNRFFYVYYTENIGGTIQMVLARYQASSNDPNLADPNSELIIFDFLKNQPNSNHNGGKIAFGTDGYLYVSIGDGGGARDPRKNAQNINSVFGKILRIDVDLDGNNPLENNPDEPNGQYEIPQDNPFVNQDGLDEIYALGIRNTWKFSFDSPTGRLWGADVGQGVFEEINLIELGGNYGWDRFEATRVDDTNTPDTGDMIDPIFFYNRNNGDVSITGGYVYRGNDVTSQNPSIQGKYIYGDFASGRVWALEYNETDNTSTNTFLFRTQGGLIPTFGVDQEGEIYFTNYGLNSQIFKLVDGNAAAPGANVNGVGKWNSLQSGTNGIINTLALSPDGDIYVGGNFTEAGGISTRNLAIWNDETGWRAFGGAGPNGDINDIVISDDGDIFIGGAFTEIDGTSANNIAQWSDNQWKVLGAGTEGPVAVLVLNDQNQLFAGGAFVNAGGIEVNNIAVWDNAWAALIDDNSSIAGTNNEIRSLALDENQVLYIGGNFSTAGGNAANRIATWNGSQWNTLGDGTSGFVQALAINQDYVYAGGNFALAGGETVNRIARWNRNQNTWENLDQGLSNNVNALALDSQYIYVAGSFETAIRQNSEHIIVNNVARWSSDNSWEALGQNTNVGIDTRANTLLILPGDTSQIFVGGNFSKAGAIDASNVAFWQLQNIVNSLPAFPANAIKVFPNPTQKNLFIEYKNLDTDLINIRILDSKGAIVYRQPHNITAEQGVINLNMDYNSDGIYYLEISSLDRQSTFKIIKQN